MSASRTSLRHAVAFAASSRRTLAVTLLSFSSGLPLGLVWIAIPDWMRSMDIDIRIVGLTSLTHVPWTFKMLWSPLMDRFVPPFLGRRRGWIAIAQLALFALTLALAGVGAHPDTPWVLLAMATAIAFASASQDIVVDAYAVDALRPEELGVAVGARLSAYRVGMQVAGAIAITLAGWISWPAVCALLAAVYLPLLWCTLRAPEPERPAAAPASVRDAVWLPFFGFLGRPRALEILAFVLLYKLGDNLSQALLRPFLRDMGYDNFDRGVALGTVGVVATIGGTFLGGALTSSWGLGRCLWIFGLLQIVSNLGYVVVAENAVHRPLMYGAMAFEMATTGMGMGAFGVLLQRLTQTRFSATQYALFSSLFALPRLAAGPITGFAVHELGWTRFFWLTMVAGVPGLVMLARFVPWNARDPQFEIEARPPQPVSARVVAWRGVAGGLFGLVAGVAALVTFAALRSAANADAVFSLGPEVTRILVPSTGGDAVSLAGVLTFAAACGLCTAAYAAARRD